MWGAIIAAIASILTTIITTDAQKKENRRVMQSQLDAQQQLIQQQNAYNTPSAQMQRLQAGNLNPHLMYGQGSTGNQPSPGAAPSLNAIDFMGMGSKIGNDISGGVQNTMQNRLTASQIDATNATTLQKGAQTKLNQLQAQVIAKNPLLDDAGFKATIDGLRASAELKTNQSNLTRTQADIADKASGHTVAKVFKEVELLEQRFKLATLDAKLKAEVLKSKEFQNAILEVQKNFMSDGDITPQHILQFVQLLLMKAL